MTLRQVFPLLKLACVAVSGLATLLVAALLALPAAAATNEIAPYAGTGSAGFGGDGGPALLAALDSPDDVSLTSNGGLLIADTQNDRIRHVSRDGTISTVAGTGSGGYNGDLIGATAAMLDAPAGVAALPNGGFLIADTGNHRIRRVSNLGIIETVAGTGSAGFSGDGGPSVLAELNGPRGVAASSDGSYLIADTDNHAVRSVSAAGSIATVAGSGEEDGFEGDGSSATSAELRAPQDVALLPGKRFLVADSGNGRVRQVDEQGTISTVIGGTIAGGDTRTSLSRPSGVAAVPGAGFVVSDEASHRVLQVDPRGTISAIAGTGDPGSSGDGGAAASARLNAPGDVTASPSGRVFVSDSGNHRIRAVDAVLRPPRTDTSPGGGDTSSELPPERRPVRGVRVAIRPVRGRVSVRLPGGKRFIPLDRAAGVPVGSLIDTRRGRVRLSSVRDKSGRLQAGTFWGGLFEVRQRRRRDAFTDLHLRGPRVRDCRRRAGRKAVVSRKPGNRRLWGSDRRGRFRTHGRNGVATTRGTAWLTEERCAGTFFRVRSGAVLVRSRYRRKQVRVDAGESYLARSAR